MSSKVLSVGFIALLSFMQVQNALAGYNDAQSWELITELHYQLLSRQNIEGSWGDRPENKVRITTLAIDGLSRYSEIEKTIPLKRALTWLANSQPASADSTARALRTLWSHGIEAPAMLELLYSYGNKSDSTDADTPYYWGGGDMATASIMDTCLVLKAFNIREKQATVLAKAPAFDQPLSRAVYESLIDVLLQRIIRRLNNTSYIGWVYPERESDHAHGDILPSYCGKRALTEVANQSNVYTADEISEYVIWPSLGKTDADLAVPYGRYQESLFTELYQYSGQSYNQDIETIYDYFVNADSERSLFLVALASTVGFGRPTAFIDNDGDGIDNRLEERLGFDPDHPDADWLEKDERSFSNLQRIMNPGGAMSITLGNAGDIIEIIAGSEDHDDRDYFELNGNVLEVNAPYSLLIAYKVTKVDGSVSYEQLLLERLEPTADEDGDGIANVNDGDCTSPFVNESQLDTDGDALLNEYEVNHGLNFCLADTDFDEMPDGWEVNNNTKPLDHTDAVCVSACSDTGPCDCDLDRDGLDNRDEFFAGTNPNHKDTDGDSHDDSDELSVSRNPLFNENINLMIFLNGL